MSYSLKTANVFFLSDSRITAFRLEGMNVTHALLSIQELICFSELIRGQIKFVLVLASDSRHNCEFGKGLKFTNLALHGHGH